RTWRMPNDSPLSPTVDCTQYDSLTACARTMSSSIPHLQAPHCRISSVVPVKLPVTRAYSGAGGLEGAPNPLVWFAAAFSGRTSLAARTRAAHSASLGNGDPGGSVAKCPVPPLGGGVGVGVGVGSGGGGWRLGPPGSHPTASATRCTRDPSTV